MVERRSKRCEATDEDIASDGNVKLQRRGSVTAHNSRGVLLYSTAAHWLKENILDSSYCCLSLLAARIDIQREWTTVNK